MFGRKSPGSFRAIWLWCPGCELKTSCVNTSGAVSAEGPSGIKRTLPELPKSTGTSSLRSCGQVQMTKALRALSASCPEFFSQSHVGRGSGSAFVRLEAPTAKTAAANPTLSVGPREEGPRKTPSSLVDQF